MRILTILVGFGVATAQFGCSTKCTPQEPCVVTASGLERAACVPTGRCGTTGQTEQGDLVFDCGDAQCKGAQLCVVPARCDTDPGPSASNARCIDRPPVCTDVNAQCKCTMGSPTFGPPDDNLVCCYYAGWKPGTVTICNFECQ
jgi:hypothetical protein